jgi:Fe-S cluster assembly protein SufD
MTQVAERHDTYAAAFEAFKEQGGQGAFGPAVLGEARARAFERFSERGFPTIRNEEWRFTNVAPLAKTAFVPAPAATVSPSDVEPFLFDGAFKHRVVLVNGRFDASLSAVSSLPAGLAIRRLADVLGWEPDGPARALVDAEGHTPFADLNTALFEDGIVVEVAAKAVIDEPLLVLSLGIGQEAPSLVSPRLVLLVGEQAQVKVVESYAGIGEGTVWTNAVVQARVAPAAVVEHVKLQREPATTWHLATTAVHVERGGTFASRAITLGGRLTRNDIVSTLDGEGAECTLNGLYVADGESLVDTHTTIDHAQPQCPSHELYKGILAGKARAVFNGKIVVRPDAQKTDAKQTNRALLLSDDAQINTKPQLEIFADDVKCTHGAAIGQLDEDAMFYLQARGIETFDARNMLIHAFAGEVLQGISMPAVRETATHLMEAKLQLAEVADVVAGG